jgi:hypothetical protein
MLDTTRCIEVKGHESRLGGYAENSTSRGVERPGARASRADRVVSGPRGACCGACCGARTFTPKGERAAQGAEACGVFRAFEFALEVTVPGMG